MQYKTANIPKYFWDNGMTTVGDHLAGDLAAGFDGMSFSPEFRDQMPRKYRDFLTYPVESVSATTMPSSFSEKRQFPVLEANTSVGLTELDSLLSFFTVLLGSSPLNPQQQPLAYQSVSNVLNGLGLDLILTDPVAVDENDKPLYIVAAQEIMVAYRAGFDPNQLLIENIQPENEFYRVAFRLEICNAGAGDVLNEKVSIHYPEGAFWDFQYPMTQGINGDGYQYNLVSHEDGEWNFDIRMFLHGIPAPLPGQGHQEVCESVQFTALTNCEGVRSLWKENGGRVMEACIVFKESFDQTPHCDYNIPIASDQFKDGGNCICCTDAASSPTSCPNCDWPYWFCWLLLLILLLLLLWWLKKKYFS
jgi:hypothetical protein